MNYILIIYLIGVLVNSYFAICTLKDAYNIGKVLTIGNFLAWIMICVTSWIFLLFILLARLCAYIYSKKHKWLY